MRCVCSALAQVQFPLTGAVPEPAGTPAWLCWPEKGPGREQVGPDSAQKSLCALAPVSEQLAEGRVVVCTL